MIRHQYSGCATCHTDPSGAGILTQYGRAQSELLLSTRYGADKDAQEPSSISQFLFGVVPEPDWLLLQGWARNGYIWNYQDGKLADNRILQMRADIGAHVALGHFRAAATVGYNIKDSAAYSDTAWITHASDAGNIVSREHWVGASVADDSVLIRAGRINLPFGLRNIEHTSWVRSETHTDFNQSQQHGVAASYTSDLFRGEVMGIAGNYQISPDRYRERGYSAFGELAIAPGYALGASSLVTHAAQSSTTRQAHGLFARAAPVQPLALLAEFDMLVTSASASDTQWGYVGFLQADVEPIQGVHAIVTGEVLDRGSNDPTHFGTWFGAAWFPYSHFDIRADLIRRTAENTPTDVTFLMQLHLYL